MAGLGHYKVTVVGAGNVGATAAQRLVEGNIADVVLVDIVEGLPQGKALDIMQSAPVLNFDARIVGSNGYDETRDSDVILITAGIARKPGMSRSDLLNTNAKIVGGVVTECCKRSPDAIIVMVSNPLDVMTALAQRVSGFDDRRVIGMAGVLDSARFRCFIAMELGVSMQDVDAMVLGGHGDSMVPLPRFSTVSGIAASALMKEDRIASLVQRTRDGGAEIVKLLKTGSAYYAPSASSVSMIRSILWDEKRVLPCCVHLRGMYGLNDDWVGVPCRLGRNGVENVIELPLDPAEKAALHESARKVREDIALLG
jgi:malate dehydrogenase